MSQKKCHATLQSNSPAHVLLSEERTWPTGQEQRNDPKMFSQK